MLHQLGLDPQRLDVPGRKQLEIDLGKPIDAIIAMHEAAVMRPARMDQFQSCEYIESLPGRICCSFRYSSRPNESCLMIWHCWRFEFQIS
ncbi:MAG TPA: hypothetical protein EYG03_14200 [Planctomycetes bacterium]|nr:hypothetical protein [Planctomycetota bacterium]